jgi:hypothetical protein
MATMPQSPNNNNISAIMLQRYGIFLREQKMSMVLFFVLSLQRFLFGVLTGTSAPCKNQNRQNSF